jgi:hypothetical protein
MDISIHLIDSMYISLGTTITVSHLQIDVSFTIMLIEILTSRFVTRGITIEITGIRLRITMGFIQEQMWDVISIDLMKG